MKSKSKSLAFLSIFVLLLTAFPAHQGWSQASEQGKTSELSEYSAYPLRPPQLDSPRATLRSFIININQAIERVRNEESTISIKRAMRRALLCLDLSDIPIATREHVGIEKALLLKEILDRVEIPAVNTV